MGEGAIGSEPPPLYTPLLVSNGSTNINFKIHHAKQICLMNFNPFI